MFHLDTLSPDTDSEIPTVTDNLFSRGTISAHEIGVSFEPITGSSGEELNGEITWGVSNYYLKPQPHFYNTAQVEPTAANSLVRSPSRMHWAIFSTCL